MITIRKGKMTKEVPASAFANYYQNSGWVADDEPVKKKVVENISEPDEVSDEDWDSVMEDEKPVSEMNREELIAKAKSLGISVGNMNNRQLKDAIRNMM